MTITFSPRDAENPTVWQVDGTDIGGTIIYDADGEAFEQPPNGEWEQPELGIKGAALKALVRTALQRRRGR